MSYNLIRNGIFKSLTTSGTGNVSLSWQELEYLMDEETQNTPGAGSVTISGSDVLYLEADISSRIKVDGIRLYMTSATASGTILADHLDFYYKDEEGDSYSTCSKSLGAGYYSASITSPSAPRYVLCTISGAAAKTIYEFELFNDDYIVAFGDDGQTYAEYLEDTPIGYVGNSKAITLYNNSTGVYNADAYTCVDWSGTDADEYVEISSSENGTYYALSDGAVLETDVLGGEYRWSHGTFSSTTVSNDNVIPTASSGTYTTPIFKLDNQHNASYFIIGGTAVSGTGSISYDSAVFNGSIRVKNSDTEPIPLVEAWYLYFNGTRYVYCSKYVPYTNATTSQVGLLIDNGANWDALKATSIAGEAVSNIKERIAYSWGDRDYYNAYKSNLYIVNRSGTTLYTKSSTVDASAEVAYIYFFSTNMEFDQWGGIWGYGPTSKYLYHFNYSLATTLASIYDGSDFLYDLSADLEDGVWYTNKNTNQIIHLAANGSNLKTINQRQPRALCVNQDETVWVNDTSDSKFRKFNSNGTQLAEYATEVDFTRMRSDFNNGFWAYNSSVDNVYHYSSSGVLLLEHHFDRIDKISTSHEGCTVFDDYANRFDFLNFDGVIYRSRTVEDEVKCAAMFSLTFDKDKEWGMNDVPATHDPLWGSSAGTLEWNEVKKDGYFLPKVRYHQAEVTLRDDATLEKIIIAPAVKTQDIAPGTSKDMYIRTNIPEGADVANYSTKLRTWWGEVA